MFTPDTLTVLLTNHQTLEAAAPVNARTLVVRFIEEMEEAFVLSISVSDVIDGSVKMPFTGRVA